MACFLLKGNRQNRRGIQQAKRGANNLYRNVGVYKRVQEEKRPRRQIFERQRELNNGPHEKDKHEVTQEKVKSYFDTALK